MNTRNIVQSTKLTMGEKVDLMEYAKRNQITTSKATAELIEAGLMLYKNAERHTLNTQFKEVFSSLKKQLEKNGGDLVSFKKKCQVLNALVQRLTQTPTRTAKLKQAPRIVKRKPTPSPTTMARKNAGNNLERPANWPTMTTAQRVNYHINRITNK